MFLLFLSGGMPAPNDEKKGENKAPATPSESESSSYETVEVEEELPAWALAAATPKSAATPVAPLRPTPKGVSALRRAPPLQWNARTRSRRVAEVKPRCASQRLNVLQRNRRIPVLGFLAGSARTLDPLDLVDAVLKEGLHLRGRPNTTHQQNLRSHQRGKAKRKAAPRVAFAGVELVLRRVPETSTPTGLSTA